MYDLFSYSPAMDQSRGIWILVICSCMSRHVISYLCLCRIQFQFNILLSRRRIALHARHHHEGRPTISQIISATKSHVLYSGAFRLTVLQSELFWILERGQEGMDLTILTWKEVDLYYSELLEILLLLVKVKDSTNSSCSSIIAILSPCCMTAYFPLIEHFSLQKGGSRARRRITRLVRLIEPVVVLPASSSHRDVLKYQDCNINDVFWCDRSSFWRQKL